MSNQPIMMFLERLGEDEQLFREVAEVAARHGIDLLAGELSNEDLDAVAGGYQLSRQFEAMSAATDDAIDSSKSNYEESRELLRLAQSVMRQAQARRSQVTRKFTG